MNNYINKLLSLFKIKKLIPQSEYLKLEEKFKKNKDRFYLINKTLKIKFLKLEEKSEKDRDEFNLIKNTLETKYLNLEEKFKKNKERFDLINNILTSEKNENRYLIEYDKIYEENFLKFANENRTLANEAEIVLEFQKIRTEIGKMINFDFLYSKNIISVGGSFSAGKSEFLNGFFINKELRLPVGINPVTAIPTYISHGKDRILGYSSKGGVIKLRKELYSNLSHDYMKEFKFNIKEIMPFVVIETNIKNGEYENIFFIDTPGYNPATKLEDKETAWSGIQYSNSLIWVIASSSGTLTKSDLEFLSDVKLEDKKKYIVLNKTDLKSENEINEIIQNILEILEENMIEIEGISAYSSLQRKEYTFEKLSLFEFLKKEDKKIRADRKIKENINLLFDLYEKSITEEINKNKIIRTDFRKMERKILEGNFSNSDSLLDQLSEIESNFYTSELEKTIEELVELARNLMINKVKDIFPGDSYDGRKKIEPEETIDDLEEVRDNFPRDSYDERKELIEPEKTIDDLEEVKDNFPEDSYDERKKTIKVEEMLAGIKNFFNSFSN